MDPTEIAKHIPEVVSVAKVAAASIPFTGIIKRMLGPAADEVAEMWRDRFRLYRYERQLKCVEKAEQMAQEAGFTPQAVPPKILFPLLEGASFEENEDLHTMWAALLANAASPDDAAKVRPGFITTLKQMAPDEAAILQRLYDETLGKNEMIPVATSDLHGPFIALGFDISDLETCLNGLEGSRLIHGREDSATDLDLYYFGFGSYSITNRGCEFVEACRPPKSTS